MSGSGQETPEQPVKPLVSEAAPPGRRTKAIIGVLVALIVVLAGALGVQVLRPSGPGGPAGALAILAASAVVTQGNPLDFSLQNLRSGANAVVDFGDGSAITTASVAFSHVYRSPGTYLVYVRELAADGSLLEDTALALSRIIVAPFVPTSLTHEVSVPTIYFNITQNPKAPIVTAGTPVYLYGNYTQTFQLWSSSEDCSNAAANISCTVSSSVTVDRYVWDFGDAQVLSIPADPATAFPTTNPTPHAYSARGSYGVTLTLYTANATTIEITNTKTMVSTTFTKTTATYSFSVGTTVAAGTATAPFDVFRFKGLVPSPGVITEIVNSPGGPFSFDPQIDFETVGFEVVVNTRMTLLFYDGSSTTSFIPFAAEFIPTEANGGIRDNFKTYTFHLRSGLGFSNGDALTAYDVWYSTVRAMLFQGGVPGTAGWIISRYLVAPPIFSPFVPIMTDPNNVPEFNAISNGVSYDNATNNVTFHLVSSTPPSLFFTAVVDPLGMGIMDARWLISVGAGITFTPKGFFEYQKQGVQGSYNQAAQLRPVASGVFEINTYVPGTTVVLTPNPHYAGLPKIPKQTNTIIIEWVSSPAIAYQLFQSGEGDIVTLLTPPYFKVIKDTLVQAKQAVIQGPVHTITELFFPFNVDINQTVLSTIAPGSSIPRDYFANPLVRKAFAYAFNYTNYVDRILGNKLYGFDFGSSYCGIIVKGLPYHPPEGSLTGCPTYDLTLAKQFMQQSGQFGTAVNFPIVIPSGDETDFTAARVWADALHFIDSNIVATPQFMNFVTIIANLVPGSDGMPLYSLGWIADYPYPSDYTDAMYLVGGTYPAPDGWDPAYLGGLAAAHPSQMNLFKGQADNYTMLSRLITQADLETDPAKAAQLYAQVEQIAVNLYIYVFSYQANVYWVVKPWIQPFQGDWTFQFNPTIGAAGDSIFWWWVKG